MTITHRFEAVLLLIAACVVLTVVARRLRLPQASALIIGGAGLALVPGMPAIELDPDLVLVLFLPPLLLLSAYMMDWRAFRSDLRIIAQLAIGAVAFTTFAVGWAAHLVLPELPLAACFALGAIVSPPDAVAARTARAEGRVGRHVRDPDHLRAPSDDHAHCGILFAGESSAPSGSRPRQ